MILPIVSIIIPVYKTERFLRECLDSILAQTYINWECLLIDDGSPDNCGPICDEYADRDSRFRVFHKENGGVSSARNVGLDNCVGEYVTFVDSDDTIAPDYLDAVRKFEGDLMVMGYSQFPIPMDIVDLPNGYYENEHYKSIISKYLHLTQFRTPWTKIFKHSIIGNLRFDEKLKIGEDTLFCLSYYALSSSVVIDSSYKYQYRFISFDRYYFNLSNDIVMDTVQKLFSAYQQLSISNAAFVSNIYYIFRGIIVKDIVGVNLWFRCPIIKTMYVQYIHSLPMFLVSYLRWLIVALYKYCVNK